MKSARKDIDTLKGGIDSIRSTILGFGSVLAAGFTVNSLRATADEIGRLKDDATKLGFATEKLQGLERFAELAGASAGDVVTGLGKMEVSINKGSEAFARLGLQAAQLKAMKPEEAFLRIADAIQKIGNASERMAAMREIFGKGGASLLPTIMEGGLAEGMDKFGSVRSEEAAAIDAASDAATELKFAFKDLQTTLINDVGPGFKRLVEGFTTLIGGKVPLSAGAITARAAQKHEIDRLSDKMFLDFMRANPMDTLTPNQQRAARDRVDRMAAAQQAPAELLRSVRDAAPKIWDSIASAFSKNDSLDLMPKWVADVAGDIGKANGDLGLADIVRVQNAVDEAIALSKPNDIATPKRRDAMETIHESAALEQGTAAAFSQGRRSQQASQLLDIQKQSLKENQAQTKALQSIDQNLKATQQPVTVNIA